MGREFLSLHRAALHVGTSRQVLHRMIATGKIPVYKDAFDGRLKLLAVRDLVRLRQPQRMTVERERKAQREEVAA